jgi:hypothetical protein
MPRILAVCAGMNARRLFLVLGCMAVGGCSALVSFSGLTGSGEGADASAEGAALDAAVTDASGPATPDATSSSDGQSPVDASGCPVTGLPTAESLVDNIYTSANWGTQGTVTFSDAGLTAVLNGIKGDYDWGYTLAHYQLTCSQFVVKVPNVTKPVTGAQTFIYLQSSKGQANFILEGGGFQFGPASGNSTDLGPYDATKDVWWRLRERGGVLSFDTSADGTTWTPHGSALVTLDLSNVSISLGGGTYLAVSNPGNPVFRCLNTGTGCQ